MDESGLALAVVVALNMQAAVSTPSHQIPHLSFPDAEIPAISTDKLPASFIGKFRRHGHAGATSPA